MCVRCTNFSNEEFLKRNHNIYYNNLHKVIMPALLPNAMMDNGMNPLQKHWGDHDRAGYDHNRYVSINVQKTVISQRRNTYIWTRMPLNFRSLSVDDQSLCNNSLDDLKYKQPVIWLDVCVIMILRLRLYIFVFTSSHLGCIKLPLGRNMAT